MKRILVSQNERNNGTDYLIENGVLINDEDKTAHYGRVFSKTDNWEEIHKDNFVEVRKNENQLLIKSFYNDKDVAGRIIYYMYLIEKEDSIETILDYLKKDSQLINRTFDRERVHKVIEQIEDNGDLKKNTIKYIAITAGALALIYLLTRIKL